MMLDLKSRSAVLGLSAALAILSGCSAGAADTATFKPRPYLQLTLIDPSYSAGEGDSSAHELPVVLVNHTSGDLVFDAHLGVGGEGIFPKIPYRGFSSSLDVYGDGSVILVPIVAEGKRTTGMFVNLPSGKRYLFTETALDLSLKPIWNVTTFGLRNHKFHDGVAHFPQFEN